MGKVGVVLKGTLLCGLLMVGGIARANMTIYPMAVDIGAQGESAATIQVYSKTEETQFVKVFVTRVLKPGTPEEHEERVDNWEGVGLVVSPPKFALPAGSSRAVRLVGMTTPKSEEVYRVYFERVPLPSTDDARSAAPVTAESSVSVNLIWGVLVRMVPANPQPSLERIDAGHLRNTGNIRIELRELGHCTGADDASCTWQKLDRNIYPGMDLELPGAPNTGALRIKYQVDSTPGIQSKDLAVR